MHKRGSSNNIPPPLVLSTAPDFPYFLINQISFSSIFNFFQKKKRATHWKQELFIFDESFSLQTPRKIEGEICITRNSYWRRHYNIDITFQVDQLPACSKSFNRWREKTKNKYEDVLFQEKESTLNGDSSSK